MTGVSYQTIIFIIFSCSTLGHIFIPLLYLYYYFYSHIHLFLLCSFLRIKKSIKRWFSVIISRSNNFFCLFEFKRATKGGFCFNIAQTTKGFLACYLSPSHFSYSSSGFTINLISFQLLLANFTLYKRISYWFWDHNLLD